MKKTIGIFAHVDAGKTTFSERLLYATGAIRELGRVDQQTSFLDTNEIERRRGITIFADQAVFQWSGDTYYLIDTPGHVDFSAETERTIGALDYAILLVSGSSGVEAHTTTLFRLLQAKRIPTFFFINKADLDTFRLEFVLEEIRDRLAEDAVYLHGPEDVSLANEALAEFVAERDEAFLEAYLNGTHSVGDLQSSLIRLVQKRQCFPVTSGSALKDLGIDRFLSLLALLTPTAYGQAQAAPVFRGRVYKVRHDSGGNRLVFVKVLAGSLRVKDEFSYEVSGEILTEKVNEIRAYNGIRYEPRQEAVAGDVVAVTGLKIPICGSMLHSDRMTEHDKESYSIFSTLQAQVEILDETSVTDCLGKLRLLEDEEPTLSVTYREASQEILVSAMGTVQLEVLEQLIVSRFGIPVAFGKPQVQYRETIAAPIVGYGHFEPLRHYAEVQLRLEPNPRGTGITFASECHVDDLTLNFQRLIESHVFEKDHKGTLTGSSLTDVHIVLQDGRAHEKHTSGGDFREATYRAIRQGLEKAESVLLEPYYRFEVYVDTEHLGRVLSDIQKLHGTFEPPVQSGNTVRIGGRGPVATFMNYSADLVSFTKGRGSITFIPDGYEPCHDPEEVIVQIGYDKVRDLENPSASVFCAKGTSFVVPWDEAENYMHTI